ncbi:hypothetical protein [Lysinibacillus boronitolerans]|uniref:DUF4871 domain-containing protein n=1 Tax=Lysinibacillus boronitolerans JCM 21713 = 10a = NBRC 103108 TaxID=1294264 RepID=A0ABR4XVK0_9BACI|nr:hypothetical protein [Lysinibacillus boronitolerans]KGR82405.1 hypothetical protein CD31_18370 [Lysinibacillus boronitolerans JCM 21713 = 10a = NBRC 103108]
MKRIVFLCIMLLFLVGCADEAKVTIPEDLPEFVQEDDFASVDWDKKAVEFGDRGIIGNADKSGVIGANMPSLSTQKWMWHLWGIDEVRDTELTIIGYHRDSKVVQPILVDGWSIRLGGPVNGADAHTPSHVKIPQSGEWAILLYTNGKYFDTLIYDIQE